MLKKVFFYLILILNAIYSYDGKAEFSAAINPVFVLYDPSEIILIFYFCD